MFDNMFIFFALVGIYSLFIVPMMMNIGIGSYWGKVEKLENDNRQHDERLSTSEKLALADNLERWAALAPLTEDAIVRNYNRISKLRSVLG